MTTDLEKPGGTTLLGRIRTWWNVVWVIVGLELRQRLRTTRWRITLAAAFAVLSLVVFGSLYVAVSAADSAYKPWAQNLYAIVMGLLLFIGLVLSPTLTATAINGDRKDATLAVVQATPVTNWQLAWGKLLGNWAACVGLVVVAAPYLIWGMIAAPYGFGGGLLGIAVLILLLACYCGIGLGLSSLTARPAGSAVLTQAAVFVIILGLPALFGMLLVTTEQKHSVTQRDFVYEAGYEGSPRCVDDQKFQTFHHTERIWWLLAPNPYLILPDIVAAYDNPRKVQLSWGRNQDDPTVAHEIASLQSEARSGPFIENQRCDDTDSDRTSHYERQLAHGDANIGNNWYIGLFINMVFGGLGLAVAARRLRVPARKIAKGVRIA